MELVFKHPDDPPVERTNDLFVIVACEDTAIAPRVRSLLQRIGQDAGEQGRLVYNWWSFAVLASPSLRRLASREAEEADMVVICGGEARCLPEAVKEWLGLWLANQQHQPRPRALVALPERGSNLDAASQNLLSELKEMAESAEVDFFANGGEGRSDVALIGEQGGQCRRPAIRQVAPTGALRGLPDGAEGVLVQNGVTC